MNKEGYLNRLIYTREKNILKMFIFMLIVTERTSEADILISGKYIYDTLISD